MDFKAGNDSGIDSKHFVKLKDKDSIVGVFRGDPYDFKQHWVGDRSQVCQAKSGPCPECEKKNKPGFRFRLNFVTKENGLFLAKIFEQGWNVYEQLKALHQGDYKLDKTIVRITRNGMGKQTSYTIIPIPKGDVTPAIEKDISSIKLHDLQNLAQEEPGALGDAPPLSDHDFGAFAPHDSSNDIPF